MEVATGLVVVGYDDHAVEAGIARTEATTKKGLGTMNRLALGFAATLGFAAVKGTELAINFHKQMTLIQTSAGASAADVKELTKQVLDLARVSPYGPEELAKALYHLKSLGLDNAHAMAMLRVGIKGAVADGADLESVVNALGGAVRTQIKGTQDYGKAQATINAIVGAGNMRLNDLTAAFSTGVLPAAKTVGLSLTDVGAALATMTDENQSADQAATRLRMTFSLLAAGSEKAEKSLGRIGLSTEQLGVVMSGPDGLAGAIGLLKSHLDQLQGSKAISMLADQVSQGSLSLADFEKRVSHTAQFDILSHAFGGGRSAATIMLLVNNLEVLRRKYEQIRETAHNFNEEAAAGSRTAANRIKTDWSTVEVALIHLGDKVTPVLLDLDDAISKTVGWFDKTHGAMQGLMTIGKVFLALWVTTKLKILAATAQTKLYEAQVALIGPKSETAAATVEASATKMSTSFSTVNGKVVLLNTDIGLIGTDTEAAAAKAGAALDGLATKATIVGGTVGTAALGMGAKLAGIATRLGPTLLAIQAIQDFMTGQRYNNQDKWSLGGVLHALNPLNYPKDIYAFLGGHGKNVGTPSTVKVGGTSVSALSAADVWPLIANGTLGVQAVKALKARFPDQSQWRAAVAYAETIDEMTNHGHHGADIGNTSVPGLPGAGGVGTVKKFKNLQLPYSLQIQAADASATKATADDIASDKAQIAFWKFIEKSKRATKADIVTAHQEIASAENDIESINEQAAEKEKERRQKEKERERKRAAQAQQALLRIPRSIKRRVAQADTSEEKLAGLKEEAAYLKKVISSHRLHGSYLRTAKNEYDSVIAAEHAARKGIIADRKKENSIAQTLIYTIPDRLRIGVDKAAMTASLTDDIAALQAEEDWLKAELTNRVASEKTIRRLNDELAAVNKKLLQAKKDAHQEVTQKEVLAFIQDRGALFSQYASGAFSGKSGAYVFHSSPTAGPAAVVSHKTVNVTQNFLAPPSSHFVNARNAYQAARNSLD